jgi:hypothetical protein
MGGFKLASILGGIGSVGNGCSFTLNDMFTYTSNPIVLAISLFVIIDLVLLIILVIGDTVKTWRLFFGMSVVLALAIPLIIGVYEFSKKHSTENKTNYTSPPPAFYSGPPPAFYAGDDDCISVSDLFRGEK